MSSHLAGVVAQTREPESKMIGQCLAKVSKDLAALPKDGAYVKQVTQAQLPAVEVRVKKETEVKAQRDVLYSVNANVKVEIQENVHIAMVMDQVTVERQPMQIKTLTISEAPPSMLYDEALRTGGDQQAKMLCMASALELPTSFEGGMAIGDLSCDFHFLHQQDDDGIKCVGKHTDGEMQPECSGGPACTGQKQVCDTTPQPMYVKDGQGNYQWQLLSPQSGNGRSSAWVPNPNAPEWFPAQENAGEAKSTETTDGVKPSNKSTGEASDQASNVTANFGNSVPPIGGELAGTPPLVHAPQRNRVLQNSCLTCLALPATCPISSQLR